jgi:putative salt-induced outer membrane protein YdiY
MRMMVLGRAWRAAPALLLAAAVAGQWGPVAGQDEKELGWADKAELTLVTTNGNSSLSTFGLKNALEYVWPRAALRFAVGGIRTESKTFTRVAQGTADNFTVQKTYTSAVTAEAYYARGRYDHDINGNTFLFLGSGWERSTFAGIGSRVATAAGIGRSLADREGFKLRIDLGLTYTLQQDVDASERDSFAGARLSYELSRRLTETTELSSALILDENQENTDDLRADFTNSISVTIAQGLALKASYQLLFDNDPALKSIPLGQTGTTVLAPLEKADGILTLAVVLTF